VRSLSDLRAFSLAHGVVPSFWQTGLQKKGTNVLCARLLSLSTSLSVPCLRTRNISLVSVLNYLCAPVTCQRVGESVREGRWLQALTVS
jgi:hypothetical protein